MLEFLVHCLLCGLVGEVAGRAARLVWRRSRRRHAHEPRILHRALAMRREGWLGQPPESGYELDAPGQPEHGSALHADLVRIRAERDACPACSRSAYCDVHDAHDGWDGHARRAVGAVGQFGVPHATFELAGSARPTTDRHGEFLTAYEEYLDGDRAYGELPATTSSPVPPIRRRAVDPDSRGVGPAR